MIKCPLCDFENIEGVDVCEQCGQPLHDSHLRSPTNAVERGLLKDRVASLSPKKPIVVRQDTSVRDVLKLMHDRSIGCVFVIDDGEPVGEPVGVFSERDALMRLNVDAAQHQDAPVSKFMTPNPQRLAGDDRIAFAVHQMDVGGYRHVPIVDANNKAVGVISVRDILRYMAEKITSSSAG